METLPLKNPFPGAAAFLISETSSTMDEARRLARMGFPAGSVVMADSQSSGRGRVAGRMWEAEPGSAILATLILGPEARQLPGLTLRMGLAAARALHVSAIRADVALEEPPLIKWPNDLLLNGKKLAGILCEAAEDRIYVGFGINVNQKAFPEHLRDKATSLVLASEPDKTEDYDRSAILELLMAEVAQVLMEKSWKEEVEDILWRRGQTVRFSQGLPDHGGMLEGVLEGVDADGSLLIKAQGRTHRLLSGELVV